MLGCPPFDSSVSVRGENGEHYLSTHPEVGGVVCSAVVSVFLHLCDDEADSFGF